MSFEYETGRITHKFIMKLKDREAMRVKEERILIDSKFQQEFYADLAVRKHRRFLRSHMCRMIIS